MIKFVYKICPALVIYKKPKNPLYAGYTQGFIVFIDPAKQNDIGLLMHELTHVKQAYKGLFIIHGLKYIKNLKYRLACEIEAYKVQMTYNPEYQSTYANFIANRYGLNIDEKYAYYLLGDCNDK